MDAERRTEARYPTEEPVELEILAGPSQPIFGMVLDVSRSGLRISIPKSIDRGAQVKLKLQHNVIFGDIRYCRSVSGAFHIGVRIEDLVRPAGWVSRHVAADLLSLYAVGKGLSVPEIIEVRDHLGRCHACRARLADKQALLNASTAKPLRPPA